MDTKEYGPIRSGEPSRWHWGSECNWNCSAHRHAQAQQQRQAQQYYQGAQAPRSSQGALNGPGWHDFVGMLAVLVLGLLIFAMVMIGGALGKWIFQSSPVEPAAAYGHALSAIVVCFALGLAVMIENNWASSLRFIPAERLRNVLISRSDRKPWKVWTGFWLMRGVVVSLPLVGLIPIGRGWMGHGMGPYITFAIFAFASIFFVIVPLANDRRRALQLKDERFIAVLLVLAYISSMSSTSYYQAALDHAKTARPAPTAPQSSSGR